jgi:hypothetical protein
VNKLAEETPFDRFLDFIRACKDVRAWYRIESIRDNTVMVLSKLPGQYWEIEFFDNGELEIERYFSPGKIETNEDLLDDLISAWNDEREALDRIYGKTGEKQ